MESVQDWIKGQDWPTDMKEAARTVVRNRTNRKLNPMTPGEWETWADLYQQRRSA